MAKTLSIKTGKGLEIGEQKEVKAKIGNGIDFGNDNEVVAKGNTQKAIQVSEDGIELKVDNITTRINAKGEVEAIGTKPDISAGGGINLETPTGETTTEISVKTDNITTRINANGEVEAIGTKPDIEAGAGIDLNTPVGSTTTTISAKGGNGIEVDTNGINAKASDGIQVNTNGISAKAKSNSGIVVDTNGISADIDTETLEFDENGKIKVKDKAPNIESGNGIEIETSGNTKTISAKGGNGIGVGTSGISVNTGGGLHISSNKVSINANFTQKDTPLGTEDSNIFLHSDGKISVGSGGGGGSAFLYATYNGYKSGSATDTIGDYLPDIQYTINNNELNILNPIAESELKNFLFYIVITNQTTDLEHNKNETNEMLYSVRGGVQIGNEQQTRKQVGIITLSSLSGSSNRQKLNIDLPYVFECDSIDRMRINYIYNNGRKITKNNYQTDQTITIYTTLNIKIYAIPKQ